MKCGQCQSENEEDAKFCENCGAPLALAPPPPPATEPAPSPGQVYCWRCGTPNEEGSIFCESCGSTVGPQAPQPSYPISEQPAVTKKNTSAAWWLMPMFFTWLGGLIAWAVVRQNDRAKAKRLLWLGIGMAIFWLALTVLLTVAGYMLGY